MNIRAQVIATRIMVAAMVAFAAWGCATALRAPRPERVIVMPEIVVHASAVANLYVNEAGYIDTLYLDRYNTCYGVGTAPVQMPITTIHNP